jgi:hypothetical protein
MVHAHMSASVVIQVITIFLITEYFTHDRHKLTVDLGSRHGCGVSLWTL